MTHTFISIVATLASIAPPSEDVQVDYAIPRQAEAIYIIRCERQWARLQVVEEFRNGGDSLPLSQWRRIHLLGLEIDGRAVPIAQTRAAAEVLNRYSWLTRVQGLCSPRAITIEVEGMNAEAWAAFILGEGQVSRPRTEGSTISVDHGGTVNVR